MPKGTRSRRTSCVDAVESLEARRLLSAYSFQTVATFSSSNGPQDQPVLDSGGNLFGIEADSASGDIYEIAKGSTTPTPIVSFPSGTETAESSALSIDGNGDLFGFADENAGAGASGFPDGVVYEVVKGSGTLTPLASFGDDFISDGSGGGGNQLLVDSAGDVFGTDRNGGTNRVGYIWEIDAGTTSITTLASFASLSPDGESKTSPAPNVTLTMDSSGDLFGTTNGGGNSIGTGDGTVFELPVHTSTIETLATFNQSTGIYPQSNVVMDSSGNLYGCVLDITDGSLPAINEVGSIFEIPAGPGTPITKAVFTAADGYSSSFPLSIDSSGDIFGSTQYGGDVSTQQPNGDGVVFELPAGSSTIQPLHTFGSDGFGFPTGITLDPATGDLYGGVLEMGQDAPPANRVYKLTTSGGGGGGGGTAGALTPVVTKTTLPGSVVAGGKSHGAATVSLTNGSTVFKGSVTVKVYASADGAVDGSSVLLGMLTKSLSIKAGASGSAVVQIKSLPASLDGTYSLLATCAVAAGSSSSTTGPALMAAAPFIAFSNEVLTTNLTGSVVSDSKTKDTASLTLTNLGNISSAGSSTVELLVSPNGSVAAGTKVLSAPQSIVIQPGKSKTVKIPLKALPEVANGMYQLVAKLTDPRGDVTEVAATSQVQLAAAFLQLTPSTPIIVPGSKGTATVDLTITNNGNITPTGKTTVALLASATTSATDSAPETSESIPPIAPGKDKTLKIKLTADEFAQVVAAGNLVVEVTDPLGGVLTSSTPAT